MIQINLRLKKNKKAYFAGDFHLGRPDKKSSSIREKKIISWLNHISKDAQEVFLMGDVFDFWFEYRNVIPKENLRFLSTISNMIDSGINFHYFLGKPNGYLTILLQSSNTTNYNVFLSWIWTCNTLQCFFLSCTRKCSKLQCFFVQESEMP